jgi:hypothetical protein
MTFAAAVRSESVQDQLFAEVLAGASCKKIAVAGLQCAYKLGDFLFVSISDVGGTETEVAFFRSDADAQFYAAMDTGCIVVLPGRAHAPTRDPVTNVFISSTNGRVYKSLLACHAGK